MQGLHLSLRLPLIGEDFFVVFASEYVCISKGVYPVVAVIRPTVLYYLIFKASVKIERRFAPQLEGFDSDGVRRF